jgi:hypothetical protein
MAFDRHILIGMIAAAATAGAVAALTPAPIVLGVVFVGAAYLFLDHELAGILTASFCLTALTVTAVRCAAAWVVG